MEVSHGRIWLLPCPRTTTWQVLRVSSPSRFNDTLLVDGGYTLSFKGHTTVSLGVNASAEEVAIFDEISSRHHNWQKHYYSVDALDAHWLTFVLQGLRRKHCCRSAFSLARDGRHKLGMAIRAVHARRRDAFQKRQQHAHDLKEKYCNNVSSGGVEHKGR